MLQEVSLPQRQDRGEARERVRERVGRGVGACLCECADKDASYVTLRCATRCVCVFVAVGVRLCVGVCVSRQIKLSISFKIANDSNPTHGSSIFHRKVGFSLLLTPLLIPFPCPTLHADDPRQRRRPTEFKFLPSTWGARPHFECHSYSSIFMSATCSLTQNSKLTLYVGFFLSFLQSTPFSPSLVDYSVITACSQAPLSFPD